MAEGLNRVTLIGNLGQDPELRHTQGGGAVLTLRIATTESFSNRAGERQADAAELLQMPLRTFKYRLAKLGIRKRGYARVDG